MRFLTSGVSLLALAALVALAGAEDDKGKKDNKEEIVINITGTGAKAKYIKEGDAEQKDVTVTVGQSVKWTNKGNKAHSATSSVKVKDKPLFDTGELDPDKSASIKFDEQKYKDAGGQEGKPVTLEYFCTVHGKGNMKSAIILKPAAKK